ncbi:putative sigma-E factor regulatory protein [Methylocaldum marinum]|uniref:Putative sigma-E factor regulatory protein n=2 Tax=Methylocaldum marinum TaxID=1432792 RepID=A0A250L1W4_9GAMM|nr:putative sigma-E factor regulatory protein [Methylocaldum marinum]
MVSHFAISVGMVRMRRVLAWQICLMMFAAEALGGTGDLRQGDAIRWLMDMRQAVIHLDYRGIVAYLKDKHVESFQLFHVYTEGVEHERLVSMNSPLREVVRNSEKVACYFPDTKTVFVENKPARRSVLLDLPEDLKQLSRHYDIKLQAKEYVAQRLSQIISIEPRDNFRYARRIWVDLESKLPLKFELIGENDQTVEQMIFTSLSIENGIPESELNASTKVDAFTWQVNRRESMPLESLKWGLRSVPDGFQMISYTRLIRTPTEHPVEHILLSDGFSSVSIYVDEFEGDIVKGYQKKIGAINAHSRKIGRYLVTVMGDVPARTVQVITGGVHLQVNKADD